MEVLPPPVVSPQGFSSPLSPLSSLLSTKGVYEDSLAQVLAGRVLSCVPKLLLEQLAEGEPRQGNRESEAVLLFVDISGFSYLAAALQNRSLDGADALSHHLNTYFGALLDIVESEHGDVLDFSGDALLCGWYGNYSTALPHALRCGKALTATSGVPFDIGDTAFTMNVHVGCALGKVTSVIAGGVGTHALGLYHHFVMGPAVEEAGVAANIAQRSEFVVGPSAMEELEKLCLNVDIRACGYGYSVIEGVDKLQCDTPHITELQQSCQRLRSKSLTDAELIQGERYGLSLQEKERRGPDDVLGVLKQRAGCFLCDTSVQCLQLRQTGSLRIVSAVFVKLCYVASSVKKTNQAICIIQKLTSLADGLVNKVIMDDKGVVCLCLFGAPLHAHDNDSDRSIHFAVAVKQQLESFIGGVAIGITRSKSFCGLVGNSWRQEYTVLGEGVNNASRAMMYAYDSDPSFPPIACDAETVKTYGGDTVAFEKWDVMALPKLGDSAKMQLYLCNVQSPQTVQPDPLSRMQSSYDRSDLAGSTLNSSSSLLLAVTDTAQSSSSSSLSSFVRKLAPSRSSNALTSDNGSFGSTAFTRLKSFRRQRASYTVSEEAESKDTTVRSRSASPASGESTVFTTNDVALPTAAVFLGDPSGAGGAKATQPNTKPLVFMKSLREVSVVGCSQAIRRMATWVVVAERAPFLRCDAPLVASNGLFLLGNPLQGKTLLLAKAQEMLGRKSIVSVSFMGSHPGKAFSALRKLTMRLAASFKSMPGNVAIEHLPLLHHIVAVDGIAEPGEELLQMSVPDAAAALCNVLFALLHATYSWPFVLLVDDAHLLDNWSWFFVQSALSRGISVLGCREDSCSGVPTSAPSDLSGSLAVGIRLRFGESLNSSVSHKIEEPALTEKASPFELPLFQEVETGGGGGGGGGQEKLPFPSIVNAINVLSDIEALRIPPLSANEVHDCILQLCGGHTVDPRIVSYTMRVTRGVPGIIRHLVDGLIANGAIKVLSIGVTEAVVSLESLGANCVSLIPSMEAVVMLRVDVLPLLERTVLSMCAVTGEVTSLDSLQQYLSCGAYRLKRGEVMAGVAGLVERGLVSAEGGVVQFCDVFVRDVIFQAMLLRERQQYHTCIACTETGCAVPSLSPAHHAIHPPDGAIQMAPVYSAQTESSGHHLFCAEMFAQALPYLEACFHHAISQGNLDDAQFFLNRVVSCVEETGRGDMGDREKLKWLVRTVAILNEQGHFDLAFDGVGDLLKLQGVSLKQTVWSRCANIFRCCGSSSSTTTLSDEGHENHAEQVLLLALESFYWQGNAAQCFAILNVLHAPSVVKTFFSIVSAQKEVGVKQRAVIAAEVAKYSLLYGISALFLAEEGSQMVPTSVASTAIASEVTLIQNVGVVAKVPRGSVLEVPQIPYVTLSLGGGISRPSLYHLLQWGVVLQSVAACEVDTACDRTVELFESSGRLGERRGRLLGLLAFTQIHLSFGLWSSPRYSVGALNKVMIGTPSSPATGEEVHETVLSALESYEGGEADVAMRMYGVGVLARSLVHLKDAQLTQSQEVAEVLSQLQDLASDECLFNTTLYTPVFAAGVMGLCEAVSVFLYRLKSKGIEVEMVLFDTVLAVAKEVTKVYSIFRAQFLFCKALGVWQRGGVKKAVVVLCDCMHGGGGVLNEDPEGGAVHGLYELRAAGLCASFARNGVVLTEQQVTTVRRTLGVRTKTHLNFVEPARTVLKRLNIYAPESNSLLL